MRPQDLTTLSKEDLLAKIDQAYRDAKPHQDEVADCVVNILHISQEVFRRIIVKHLPAAEYTRTRVVTRLSCSMNCLGGPAHELSRRLNKFAEQGVKIVRVEFDEILCEYIFHAEATGEQVKVQEEES